MMNESEEEEYELEYQEDRQLDRILNLEQFMKNINTQIFYIYSSNTEMAIRRCKQLLSAVKDLDAYMEDYNKSCSMQNREKLIFFKIDVASLVREDDYFAESVYAKEKCPGEQGYFANMVFAKAEEGNFYRMHVEIWKYDNQIVTTNAILSRFEKNCMNQLLEALTEMGFVSSIEGSAVTLRTKRPLHRSASKNVESSINVMECLKESIIKFLKQMTTILTKETICDYCKKFKIYDSKLRFFMPPTLKYEPKCNQNFKKLVQYQQLYHESCYIHHLRVPSIIQQLAQKLPKLNS